MKLQTAYLAYTDLTPGLENSYIDITHNEVIKILRANFFNWKSFFKQHGNDFSLGFYISTKKGTEKLTFYGPSISRKMKIVDYTMFIPDKIGSLDEYIDLIFIGFANFLSKYNVPDDEILKMKEECKKELGL